MVIITQILNINITNVFKVYILEGLKKKGEMKEGKKENISGPNHHLSK